MQQTPKDPLISPCIRSCQLDDDDICIRCQRSLDEIKSWRLDGLKRRKEILANCYIRRAKQPARKAKHQSNATISSAGKKGLLRKRPAVN